MIADRFLGSLNGHLITGSFTTVCEDEVRTLHGRWRVQRRDTGAGYPAPIGAAPG